MSKEIRQMIDKVRHFQLVSEAEEKLSDEDMRNVEAQADSLISDAKEELGIYQKLIDMFKKEDINDPKVKQTLDNLQARVDALPSEKNRTEWINSLIRDYKMSLRYKAAYDSAEKEREEKLKTATITKENIIDIFITALEGGSNYWMEFIKIPKEIKHMVDSGTPFSEACGEYVLSGNDLFLYDPVDIEDYTKSEDVFDYGDIEHDINGPEPSGVINMDSLLDAIRIVKNKYPNVYENIILEDYDANDADIFLQIAAFGEIVYG